MIVEYLPLISFAAPGCTHSTGETCGQVFWIKLAQRLHRLRPSNEGYVAEIERAMYNGVISQIPPGDGRGVHRVDPRAGRGGNWTRIDGTIIGIRQFAVLHRQKMLLNNISTCCEGQATRALGSLPEYIVSYELRTNKVYLNMFADATISLAPLASVRATASSVGEKQNIASRAKLRVVTAWPYEPNVTVTIALPRPTEFTLMLRIPGWVADGSVRCASITI